MKEKILYLVIGILIGAIVVTTVFIIYDKMTDENDKMPNMGEMVNIYQDGNNKDLKRPDDKMPQDKEEMPEKPLDSDGKQEMNNDQKSEESSNKKGE